jgi:ABC-type sugar transport system permease subunit
MGKLSLRKRNEYIISYLFIAPDLTGLFIFVILPIVFAVYISFFKWDMVSDRVFIGFENYVRLLGDSKWWNAMGRTVKFSLCYVLFLFTFSLFFAVIISRLKSLTASVVKSAFLMPYAITSVIASTLWMFLFNEKRGYVNSLLNFFSIPAQSFLGSTSQALYCIVLVLLWINIGYNVILFAASIKEIPQSYFEAATIEGASGWQVFWNITLPLIRHTSVFIFITTTIASFQIMDIILVMTRGGPAKATEVGALYIYDRSFNMMEMGYGSSLAVCLFLILLIFSLLQSHLGKERG